MRPIYNVYRMAAGVSLLFGVAVLGACSHDDLPEGGAVKTDEFVSTNPYHVNTDGAIASLRGFMEQGGGTRAASGEIANIEVLRWGDVTPASATRSAAPEMAGEEPLAYVMNFAEGGYAIVGADERQGGVVALVEQGRMSASTLAAAKHDADSDKDGNLDLATYINANVVACLEDMAAEPVQTDTRGVVVPPTGGGWDYGPVIAGGTFIEATTPMLVTKWTQWAPYNDYCSQQQKQVVPVGCGAQAAAQIYLYNLITYSVGNMEISCPGSMGNYCDQDSWIIGFTEYPYLASAFKKAAPQSTEEKYYVSKLLSYIGMAVKMKYNSTTSLADIDDIVAYFRGGIGYKNVQRRDLDKKNLSIGDIRDMIFTKKLPLHVGGIAEKGMSVGVGDILHRSGHFWVVDGWRYARMNPLTSFGTPWYKSFVHCVFGYGGELDGWYQIGSDVSGNPTYSVRDPYSIQRAVFYTL